MSDSTEDTLPGGSSDHPPGRVAPPRLSGKRVTLVFGLLLALVISAALVAFLDTRTPDGPILALLAVDSEQALVLRADPRRGHTYLTVETLAGTQRSLALFGVPPGSRPRLADDLISVPVTGARGRHEVDVFRFDSFGFLYRAGQPEPEEPPPDPARLPLTLGEGRFEVALYGDPLDQAVVFERATGEQAFRVRLPPLGPAPPQVWSTPRGFLLADGSGVARAYDRRHDAAARPPRDPQPVGGPGASFCAFDDAWLFLTRAGSLNRLSLGDEPTTRVAGGLPTDLALVACGRRREMLVLFLGDAAHRVVERVLVLDAAGQRAEDLSLAGGDAEGAALEIVDALPRFVPVVDGQGALAVVDLDQGSVEGVAACAGVRRILVTSQGSFAARPGILLHASADAGELRALAMPGLDPERTPRPEQLSDATLFVPAGAGFAILRRGALELSGSRDLELAAPSTGCGAE
ncbi:MAG: hypothetical protein GXP55_10070 [Deltaproteobacteria bacterium]|nr:hypothetical protein [Deltaproteobacteria bacterium]